MILLLYLPTTSSSVYVSSHACSLGNSQLSGGRVQIRTGRTLCNKGIIIKTLGVNLELNHLNRAMHLDIFRRTVISVFTHGVLATGHAVSRELLSQPARSSISTSRR